MGRYIYAFAISVIIATSSISGCILTTKQVPVDESLEIIYPSIYDRQNLQFQNNHTFSYTLEKGKYHALEVQETYIQVDTSEIWETGPETADVHLSYWLPNNTLDCLLYTSDAADE